MRIKRVLPFALAMLFIGTIFGWSYFRDAKPSPYKTARVTVGDIASSVAATGTLNAVVTVQVGSQVSGNIKALYADFNTRVAKGQLEIRIKGLFQARVNQARANLDAARASLLNAQAGAVKAQADISSANASRENVRAQLAKAGADVRDADAKLKRRLMLFDQGLLSKEDTDTAQAAYDADAATVQAVEAQLKSADDSVKAAEAQHDVSLAQVDSMSAQVRQSQAALAQAELDLQHTEIRAPVEVTVIARHMDVGQTVAASVGMGRREYHRPNQLSGGQQQRVAIARAIVNNPQIILADEPTGALDSRTSLEIMAIFQQLNRERSITIVLVTHEPDIAQCANRVIQFRDGVVVFDERVHKPRRAAEELNQTPQGSLDTTLASSERMPA